MSFYRIEGVGYLLCFVTKSLLFQASK